MIEVPEENSTKKYYPIVLKGIPSSSGIAIGSAMVLQAETVIAPEHNIPVEQIPEEIDKFRNALAVLAREFEDIVEKVKGGNTNISAILQTNVLIVADPTLKESIENRIQDTFSAESSIVQEFDAQKQFFQKAKDEILRERSIELDHIKKRLLAILKHQNINYNVGPDTIVVAQTLTPADVVNFKEAGVLGIITEIGGISAHASILARSFEIPEVIGVKDATNQIKDGQNIILDGFTGNVFSNPSDMALRAFHKKKADVEEHKKELGELVKLPAETKDGRRIHLLANIDLFEEAQSAFLWGAEGVGLVRSENLLVMLNYFPNEDEQFKYYKDIADIAYPNPVTIRVFDVGSDKFSEGLPRREDNPALGFRGIRFLLSRKDIYATQVRAILRASKNKNIRIMLPMISNLSEITRSKSLIEDCKLDLQEEGIPFDKHLPIGAMIETPAAAIIAEDLADHVDFFSIGTNDLTQYTIAADRMNELVSDIFDTFHPAVLRLIKRTIKAAKKKNIPVGICGEFASHAAATSLLIGMGIDELSIAPSILLETKNRIRSLTLANSIKLADDVITCCSFDDVRVRLDSEK